ncbi:MAG: type I glyceraldehyde-3-phosphate dehydrogenase [Pseudomonadota bacterium]|nr:type I glyceraldehyde-3-phosphate dehydrogenase [Pseudomonadota bacterium]MEC9076339.1 type I glyceraldehyde-3-phosphate dehydrogenase [Pseudomonadota bacterium]
MAWRLGINGYGRIGRCVVRALAERGLFDRIQLVLINDPADAQSLVHLTHYDSTHGRSERVFQNDPTGGYLLNGRSIALTQSPTPITIDYQKTPVDVVLESSGRFANRESADTHISAGAPRVLIGAPGGPDVDLTVVFGLNHHQLKESHRVVSAASCTTNCLALGVSGLTRSIEIERGFYTTIHAVTNDQVLIDSAHRDPRRGRSAHSSMIPTSTNAIKALEWVMPELSGRIQGFSMRVPTQNVSCVDLTVEFSREVTKTEIIDAMHHWSQTQGGRFAVNEEPLVSIDFNHHPASSIFDATQLMVNGRLVKLLFWYDNEWGYSNRVIDLLLHWQSISRE